MAKIIPIIFQGDCPAGEGLEDLVAAGLPHLQMSKLAQTDISLVEASEAAGDLENRRLAKHLGGVMRDLRQRQRLTIADIAGQAEISRGMLSKIENGQASTSLDTLARLAAALGVSLSHIFKDYDPPGGGAQLVRQGEGMEVVRKGTKRGHTYHLLAYDKGPRKSFEPFLVRLDGESEMYLSFEHPGTEFIYMLQGKVEYRHGKNTYLLEPGDSLTFSGEVPHGPERLVESPVALLSIIVYGSQGED